MFAYTIKVSERDCEPEIEAGFKYLADAQAYVEKERKNYPNMEFEIVYNV
jgi:hypothetical protein